MRLSTQALLKPIYLSELHVASGQVDWRYPEEMRSVLSFDLSNNGYSSVIGVRDPLEKMVRWPDPRIDFDLAFWKKEQIPYIIALEVTENRLSALVFQVMKGTSKRYASIALTNDPAVDRPLIHKLADAIQKDLFGTQGVASYPILFSERVRNTGAAGPEWFSDIWISDWDGANAKRLTIGNGYCMSPGFLPVGYFYVSSDKGQSKIYLASFQNKKKETWITLRGNQVLPAVSRNGNQIAFISDVAGRPDLFLLSLDAHGKEVGRPRQIFSAPRATQASPTFSPDGKRIAFVSDKDGPARIYVMDIPDPKKPTRTRTELLTHKCRENTAPCWSPDGSKLAYSARADGVRQIWIYDFATNQEWQLTSGEENKENPSWAPDSFHLVYNTETNDVSELFLINLAQQEPVPITSGFGQKRFAVWGPMPRDETH